MQPQSAGHHYFLWPCTCRGTIVYQFQEEVTQCVDRWGDWVRRIRRKRRNDHIQVCMPGFANKKCGCIRPPSPLGPSCGPHDSQVFDERSIFLFILSQAVVSMLSRTAAIAK